MTAQLPPGWPDGVHPPGSPDFEATAVAWLLDVVPPDYRLHGVLRRHPIALAALARHHIRACVQGAREGYRTTRTELGGTLSPHTIDEVLAVYRAEGQRLVATAAAAELIARALGG
jgi:hypothetical protein